jgi:hypothetical protein
MQKVERQMKLTRRMKRKVGASVRASGAVMDKRVKRKEYSPDGQRMQKQVQYVWEPGCLVSIQTTARAWNTSADTGIVIGPYGAGYFDVLTHEGKIIQVPGKRLRKAD